MTAHLGVYVYTRDLQRLRRFYEQGLGVAPADRGGWLPFELGGGAFALHEAGDDASRDPAAIQLQFVVDDIDEALARFTAAGAKVLRGIADEAFGKRAFLEDPEGRAFQLVKHELPWEDRP